MKTRPGALRQIPGPGGEAAGTHMQGGHVCAARSGRGSGQGSTATGWVDGWGGSPWQGEGLQGVHWGEKQSQAEERGPQRGRAQGELSSFWLLQLQSVLDTHTHTPTHTGPLADALSSPNGGIERGPQVHTYAHTGHPPHTHTVSVIHPSVYMRTQSVRTPTAARERVGPRRHSPVDTNVCTDTDPRSQRHGSVTPAHSRCPWSLWGPCPARRRALRGGVWIEWAPTTPEMNHEAERCLPLFVWLSGVSDEGSPVSIRRGLEHWLSQRPASPTPSRVGQAPWGLQEPRANRWSTQVPSRGSFSVRTGQGP